VANDSTGTINVAQMAGVTPSLNTGVRDAGTQRVTIATNDVVPISYTQAALVAGSAVIGHVIVDTTSTTAVTQATGTNLHAVLDTTSTTAVTQATATNLNAAVVGTGTAGTPAGNILTVQGVAAMTKLLVTPDSVALPANQSVNVAQIAGVTTSTGSGIADTGTIRTTQAQELTYSAGTTLKTATAAGTGPFFSICGSATKTIRIQRFTVSGTVATAAVWGDIVLKRTSTATSAGTATALTKLPFDSNSAAATAAPVNFYTVLATAGASAGVVIASTQLFPVTAISATLQPSPAPLYYAWRDTDSEAVTLRGTAQCLEANFGTTTTNAPTLTLSVVWTEK
jgi:hypothetical protein